MRRLAEDNPGEAQFIEVPDRPDEAEPQPWHDLYWRAWSHLRFERVYGAFGGELPVSYRAISQYAADHGITGSAFHDFLMFFSAIDNEWLAYKASQAPPPQTSP